MENRCSKLSFMVGPVLLLSGLALFFSLYTHWTSDAVSYKFMSPVFDESVSVPVRTLEDVWISQTDHYFSTNGRFVVHFIVQLFCGLWGKTAFAVCNALVWGILLVLLVRMCGGIKKKQRGFCWLAASCIWILFAQLPMDPPFQINYVWVATAICGWQLLFNSWTENKYKLVLIFIYSVFCGQMHEGFSIPLSAGIVMFAINRRFRLTRTQFIAGVGYGIGALLVILAPGNFVRLSMLDDVQGFSVLHFLAQSMPVYLVVISLLAVKYCSKQVCKRSRGMEAIMKIMYCAAVVSYALCCYLGYFGRPAIPLYFFLIIIVLVEVSLRKFRYVPVIAMCFSLFGIWMTYDKFVAQERLNSFSESVRKKYRNSIDGIVYVNQNDLIANKDHVLHLSGFYTKEARAEYPLKPDIVIRPEWMDCPEFERDTNMIRQVGPQAWILIQSKTTPARFIVDKVILPSILNIRMSERELKIIKEADLAFDTIGSRRVGLYVNRRPYLESSVRMIPDTLKK